MPSVLRATALAACIGALSVPMLAQARTSKTAKPIANGNYCINCTAKLAPGSIHVAKSGKLIDAFIYYNKCAPVPVPKMPKIPIKNGKFSFSGKLTDVTKKRITFSLKGHFVSSKLAVGTVNATGGGKTCKAVSFKAKYTNTGPPTF